jgi:hypothetical protein
MRDIANNVASVLAIAPATLTADNTPTAIDLQGFDSAAIMIHVGVGGITFTSSNKIEFKVEHSKDNATWDAVTSTDVRLLANADASVGTGGIVRSLVAAHAAATTAKVSYLGDRRYIRVTADFSGTHATGTPICVSVVKGHPQSRPA